MYIISKNSINMKYTHENHMVEIDTYSYINKQYVKKLQKWKKA